MNIAILLLFTGISLLFAYVIDKHALKHGFGVAFLHAGAGIVLGNVVVQTMLRGHTTMAALPLFFALIAGFAFLRILRSAAM